MTRLPLWALLPVLMVLAACSGQSPTPAATPPSVAATAESSSIPPSPANIIPTLPRQGPQRQSQRRPRPPRWKRPPRYRPKSAPPMHCPPPRDRQLLWLSPSLQSQRTSLSTAGPNGTTGPTRMETAKTPGRRPSSQRAWLRSPSSLLENAGSQQAGGTVPSPASTSRRQET